MKKLARKMMSLLMAVFMILQVILPAFATSSKAEDENPNSIKSVDKLEDDPDLGLSIKKSQEIYDKKKVKKDQDKFTIAVSIPDTNSKFRLVKRNDLKLFDDKYFETNEKASKEYWRVKDMLNDQGLDLDLEIIEDENGFKLITKEELENKDTENPYGENYSYIDFKIMDDFDFNEKGNQKLLDEDKLIFNLELLQYESLDPDFNLYEKDQEGNLKIKNQGDIFALIVDDKKSLYDTKKLEEDYNNLKLYKEKKLQKEADQKAQKEAEERDKKETQEKQKEEEAKKAQEEKAKAEKSSSNKEEKENSKEESNKEKESKTEIKVESNETSKEEKEEKTDSNKEEKDSTKEETKSEEKKEDTNKQENKKETETQKNKTKENSQAKTQEKPEEKKEEKQGLMPKLRKLFLGQEEPAQALRAPQANGEEKLNLEGKKFTINTRFDTSNVGGAIQPTQYFKIHLDDKLTVKNPSELKDIVYNGRVIARPTYTENDNTITYNIEGTIPENISVDLNIPVDYDTSKITNESFNNNGLMTITNSVSGLGVTNPKDLIPTKVDKEGNVANQIIEPGRDDVIKIIEPDDSNYKVDTDAYAIPVINDGELKGYNWTIKVSSDTDLNALGLKVNFTEVVGSGLGEFQNSNVTLKDNPIKGAFGIHDSKHHAPDAGIKEITYNFYTPVQGMQEKYMMDISIILTEKGKVGAKRIVMDGWPADKVKEATPIRSGMNNRTTVLGEFTSETDARWTVTDGVSTGDVDKDKNISTSLPLEDRDLGGKQTISSSKMAVYGLNEQGQMVAITNETNLNKTIPAKGKKPGDNQAVGTIAVYGYDTTFEETEKNPLSLAGVMISKYKDIHVDQNWNLDQGIPMPAQDIKAVDPSKKSTDSGYELGSTKVSEETPGEQASRSITIPNVKVWNIQGEREFTKTQPKIVQSFPTDKEDSNGKTISYYENHNYYDPNTKGYNIHNRGTVEEVPKMASFTIVKTDKSDPKKKLAGARFKLLGGPEVITDANGEAVFNNIAPGTYTIFETKAPNGYKSNQENATINIDKEGRVSLEGGPASISAGANPTQTVEHGGYPDYMNAMQYATKDDKGNVTTYIFLKANEEQRGGSTDRDTRLNLRMDNGSVSKVEVFDVDPNYQRKDFKSYMTSQTVESHIKELGGSVLNSPHTYPINGGNNVYDDFLKKYGYQISLPKERFASDWGFLVKVTGTGDSLTYDWLTNEDTGNQAKLRDQKIVPSTSTDTDKTTKITITNEAFETRPVEVTKLEKVKNAEGKEETKPIAGATFVIKDENGDVISTITSGKDGKVSFGKMPGGKYTIEETQAPEGYVKSNVVFDVTVDGTSQATYKPRFKNGSGYPVKGQDYLIKDEEQGQDDSRATVTSVTQDLYVNDKENGSIGSRPGIWEAYFLESLSYTAKIQLENSAPGTRFSIQFDPNLDFTQYFSEFPKVKSKEGIDIADPYFDYTTNKLTYVFNEKSKGGVAEANIKLVGMIPSKYFAQNDGTYNFTVTVAPGQEGLNNNTITKPIVADYNLYYYDPADSRPSQSYYFRDVYKADDGNWYVTALAYYNPDYVKPGTKNVLNFNWKSVKHYTAGNYVKWKGDGTTPPYDLTDVKIYQTAPRMGTIDLPELQTNKKVNYNMPLSFGVRPEQDPSTYHLIYSRSINPNKKIVDDRDGDVVLNYDPNKLNTWGTLEDKGPLNIQMPSVNNKNKDGYIIEQTFKIDDINKFNNTWRAFNMSNGPFNSAFVTKANANIAIADQTGGEIPKFYSQEVGLFNKKYEPGKFSILKQDETNNNPLSNATFSLTDEDNNVIYRSSGTDGIVSFKDLKPGSYILKEEIPPKDFVKTDRRWNVNVSIDGNVTITEIGLNASGETLHGKDIKIPVGNKPTATEFRVYKKDADNKPLEGAEFKITKAKDGTQVATGKSGADGVVTFDKKLEKGTYILEETKSPDGYQKLDNKWVVEIDNNKVKIYTYNEKQSDPSEGTQQFENSLLTEDGVNWVNVSQRPTDRFITGDNRQTGYADKSSTPYKLGTRIVGINKTGKYAIQRYVINPEGKDIDIYNALIHREKLWDDNMSWYAKNEDVRIYTLDKPVTTNVEDIRLYSYNLTDITEKVDRSPLAYSYSDRLQLVFNEKKLTDTNGESLIKGKPIIVDVKIPYISEYGGVGTGMDLNTSEGPSWKSDYYEQVSDIVVGDPIKKDNITDDIKGSYISDDYLDVTNEKKRYEFSIDKVNQEENASGGHDAVTGATFKLVGPKPSEDTRWTKSDENGKVSFKDLVPGIYNLVETGAAKGYKKANTDWTVTIEEDGKIYIKDNNKNGEAELNSELILKQEDESQNNLGPVRTMAFRSQDPTSSLKVNPESIRAQIYGPYIDPTTNLLGKVLDEYMDDKENKNLENQIQNVETGVNAGPMGLEIGDEIVPEAQRAGNAVTYDILGTISDAEKKYVKVTTNAKYLGEDEFLVRIDVRGNLNVDRSDVSFDLQLHDDVTFVPNSTTSWKVNANDKDKAPENPSRWHTGYDPNTKKIGVRNGVISINKGDTASMEFKVKMKSDLNNAQVGYIVNSLKVYNIACDKLRAKKFNAYTIHQNTQGGTIITEPLYYQRNGQPVTFTAKPNPGYRLVGNVTVTNDKTGRDVPIRNGIQFKMPTSDVTINATFEAETYNISYTNPNGGQVTGPKNAKTDEQVTVTTRPENGYKFDKLIVTDANGQSVSTDGNSFVMPAGNVKVSAQFKQDSYTIGYQSPQNGSVELPQTAKAGDTVTITATPDEGYMVDTITVNSGQGKVDVTGNTFVMPKSNVVVNVTFKLKPAQKYNVTVSQTQNGSVSAEPTSQEAEKTVNLTVKPDQGYKLESLSVKDASGNDVTVNNNSFTMPKTDVTISATFVEDSTTAEEGPIKIDPNNKNVKITFDPQNPKPGEKVTITVRPNPGYELKDLIVKDSNGKPIDIKKISPLNENNRPSIAPNRIDKLENQSFSMNNRAMFTSAGKKSLVKSESKNFVSLESTDQATNFGQGEKTENGLELSEEIVNDSVRAEESSISKYTFKMPASPENPDKADSVTISATTEPIGQEDKGILISDGKTTNTVQITNRKDGITPKVIKTDSYGTKLKGATFIIKKMTDDKYEKVDEDFKELKGTSDANGNVIFKDEDGNVVKLKKGYYLMTEEKSPDGYKRITAPWKMEVKDEGGRMSSVYKGPTDTPSSFIDNDKKANAKDYNAQGDIKVKSRLTYINPESKTYVQRIYIDTRKYTGGDFLNVQISPKYKREEIDRPGLPPVTIKEGVKTAYRSTYEILNPGENEDINKGEYDKILRTYDLSDPNMSMVNTARWRPFDWGFDEDQLNIGKGVYIVEVEGYYDDTIIDGTATNEVYIDDNYNFTDAEGNPSEEPVKKAPYKKTDAEMNPEDYGKIDLHVDFYKGKREFEQLVYSQKSNSVYFDTIIGDTGKNTAAYQGGAEALRKYLEATKGKETADAWAKKKPAGQKYANFISKKVTFSNGDYITGKVEPSVAGEPYHHADTSVNLNPIYSSDTENDVPKDGLVIENEKEKYNITFSKHGRDNPDDKADSQKVTENRLEGAVFKLQKLIGGNYEDVKGSTVASAFNGYFGFRNLEPGRYRLMEVQAPKGYRPIKDALLSFTIETIKTDSGKIVDPETGKIIDIKTINVKFPGDTNAQALTSLYMTDPKDSTKKIKINKVDSKEINMETIIYKSADATNGKPLKELILVVSDGSEYALLQTKIISDSSGFVSLEYEGANGVYQYVPEKSTSVQDGKLVDFVTSATAKNMGKIVNEKPGKGEVTINKKDGDGKPLEGAEFKLTRLSRKKTKDETDTDTGTGKKVDGIYNSSSNSEGKIEFKDLPIGNYELVETNPVDGYQNKGQIWHFTVGGEGLDPYSGPIERTGVDLTSQITLKESNMTIIRPDNDPDKQTENTIWPNSAQLFRFDNDFELTNGKTIRPGDYFQVKLSDYTDLYGIYNKDLVSGLDIFADGVGTIAKAEYDDAREIITYTFTEYARTYELKDFNTSIVSHIDRFKFKTSANNVPVGIKMNRENTTADDGFKNVNVRFDLGTHFAQAHGTRPNLSSKITYFDTKSGEFEHIFYINRDQDLISDGRFTYLPDKGVENLRMQVFRVNDNLLNHYNSDWQNNMNYILPPSYAVDVNDFVNKGYIYLLNNYTYYGDASKTDPAVYTFPNGYLQPEDTYIIRVTGSIKDKTDTADYEAQGKIDRYNYYNQPYMGAERHDYVYGLLNETNAEAKLEITATNPKNEISFKKTDSEGRVLEGAKFALVKYDDTKAKWTEVNGSEKTTKKDGLVTYEKLAPGKYALIEKEAPTGYNKIEGHIEEFTVDKDGIITKEVTRPKGSDNPVGTTPEDGTQPDTPKPDTGTTTPSFTEDVLNTVTEVLGDSIDKVTGEDTETVNVPIGTDPINVVNYKNIEFVKVDGDDNTKTLQGAVFEIHYKEEENGEYAALTKKETVDGKEVDKPITVTSGEDGKFKLPISKDGYYALVETKAPEGYGKIPGKIKEFKLESGSLSVLEKDPLKASLTKGKKGQITSQVLSVDKDNKTFTQRIVINPKHESLTGINDSSYLRILENGWSITPKVNNNIGGGEVKVALLKKDPGEKDKKSIAELTSDDFKTYNPVSYTKVGTDTGSRYSLKALLGQENTTENISTTDTIVVEYTGTLADITKPVDQKAEFIIDNKILDTASYNLDVEQLSKTDPTYVDVEKSNITPIPVENKKLSLPMTSGLRAWIGFTIIGLILMLLAAYYYNKKKNKGLDLEKNS